MQLLARVRRFTRRHRLAGPETRVVAALSGGCDSVALVHLLRDLTASGDLTLVGVAHLNHQLRSTADRDESFARALAASLGLEVYVERADIMARVRGTHRSLENAAHVERYEFFERARAHFRGDVVALGHTRDDQAETLLLRLLRGAGERGLAGMFPRHGTIVRPLLDCRRGELHALLESRGVQWVEDESNRDVAVPRNRVRAELLPLLAERFNPAIVDVLADEAALAREAWDWMTEEADVVWREAVDERGIDLDRLARAPRALARLVVWRAMSASGHERPITFAHVDAALQLIESGRDGFLDVPGQRLHRIGARLVLTGRRSANVGNPGNLENPANLFRHPLSIPGEVRVAGGVVTAEPLDAAGGTARGGTVVSEARVRRDLVGDPLAVRSRRPGDRFRPVGLGGRKKLQDYFVDRKVARERRDFVPIVVDGRDRIIWVAGHGIDEAFQVTDPAQGVLLLRLRLL